MLDPKKRRDVTIKDIANVPKTRQFELDKTHTGNEAFVRLWPIKIHPEGGAFGHKFFGWLRVTDKKYAQQFAKDKICPDISRWKTSSDLPIEVLWLVDDFNVPIAATQQVSPTPSGPLAGKNGPALAAPPPAPLPTFALPLDPEYRQHLICVP